MALNVYRAKRDFKATTEPAGREPGTTSGDAYVIQKHDATRLHYDLRLEVDGVLKSWAVTKGPSLVPSEKRLAVHVEDHPLEYGGFEGTIPKGEYGGGSVIVWDRGRWAPVGDSANGFAKGHLEFEIFGEKLKGRWHLVRLRARRGEKRENWLLIKVEDDEARGKGDADILEERPESVKTGRDVSELDGEAPGWSSNTGKIEQPKAAAKRKAKAAPKPGMAKPGMAKPETVTDAETPDASKVKKARKAALQAFLEPALATLSAKAPAGDRWIHEIKFDGYRLQARIEAGRVKLLTRSGLDWTKRFGKDVVAALQALPVGTALIDGELVVETGNGASDFSALQEDLSEGRSDRFTYYAFDLLHLDGYDLTGATLLDRKAVLATVFAGEDGSLKLSAHFEDDGGMVLRHACRLSLEGVVSKKRDAPYRPGRGKAWVKSKCTARQEFVIAGFTPSTTSRHAIGSLLLGVYDGDKLRHVGRVGTGFTAKVAEDLFARLDPLREKDSAFAEPLTADERRQAKNVRPELVAEVEFRGWTADRGLRHAAFRGLREDKPAEEVVREGGAATSSEKAPRSNVTLTHPDRIYWPEDGVTKQGLADYYMEVWSQVAPFVAGRPLSLLRCPGGLDAQCFFQKHAWKGIHRSVGQSADPKAASGEPLLSISDRDGLVALVQAGVLEIHPWGSTLAKIETPDMLIMDLDPGDGVSWEAIVSAALEVKARFEQAGLTAFVKTSGGKGLHVVAPLKPKAGWDEAKTFTKAIAAAMSADEPAKYVATVTKAKRRGKILVDYLRNGRGATAVAPYSTRARAGAAVSMPVGWDEIEDVGPAQFTVSNTQARIAARRDDPWAGFWDVAKTLRR